MIIKEEEIRRYIAETLDAKITSVIEYRLEKWYEDKVKEQVDIAIKKALSEMVIVRFKGEDK